MKRTLAIACLTTALLSGVASAASPAPAHDPHPDVPEHPTWVRGVLTGIFMLFAFAVPIGIIIRANMPEPPPSGSHDPHDAHGAHGADPHGGHSHGGGHSGPTHNGAHH